MGFQKTIRLNSRLSFLANSRIANSLRCPLMRDKESPAPITMESTRLEE